MRRETRNTIGCLGLTLGLVGAAACQGYERAVPAAAPPHDSGAGGSAPAPSADWVGSDGFGLRLLRLQAESEAGNVLLSPHGLTAALLLAWNGAAGETERAVAETLGMPAGVTPEEVAALWGRTDGGLRRSEPGVELAIANSVWTRTGFPLAADYVERVANPFGAELGTLDFSAPEASATINRWVSEATAGKIPTLVPETIPELAMAYLLNAVYFKGQWTDPFDPERTRPRPFHAAGGGSEVPMMEAIGRYAYVGRDGVEAVRLPYGTERFAMYVVLPAAGELDAWLARTDASSWLGLVGEMAEADGRVVLPRFNFAHEAKLKAPLSELGMSIAFRAGADFSAMTDRPVVVSDVLHKTVIEVNEEGSEAAAATAVEISDESEPRAPFNFVADRPFFFAIRDDESGALLFCGLLRHP